MEAKEYYVKNICGEYAYLQNASDQAEEPLFIAMALLPLGVDVGSRLLFENFEFSIIL